MNLHEPYSSNNPLNLRPLQRNFYLQDTPQIAQLLLGKGLLVKDGYTHLLVQLVETEAYLREDPASHSYRGVTKRNWPMFESGGTCYVYLSYGVNFCMNVVTRKKGCGEAVLLRAAAPVAGLDRMFQNRKFNKSQKNKTKLNSLLNGPGKLTQALGINLLHNGESFFGELLQIVDLGIHLSDSEIVASPRIGLTKAREKMYRYCIRESPWISRGG